MGNHFELMKLGCLLPEDQGEDTDNSRNTEMELESQVSESEEACFFCYVSICCMVLLSEADHMLDRLKVLVLLLKPMWWVVLMQLLSMVWTVLTPV